MVRATSEDANSVYLREIAVQVFACMYGGGIFRANYF